MWVQVHTQSHAILSSVSRCLPHFVLISVFFYLWSSPSLSHTHTHTHTQTHTHRYTPSIPPIFPLSSDSNPYSSLTVFGIYSGRSLDSPCVSIRFWSECLRVCRMRCDACPCSNLWLSWRPVTGHVTPPSPRLSSFSWSPSLCIR